MMGVSGSTVRTVRTVRNGSRKPNPWVVDRPTTVRRTVRTVRRPSDEISLSKRVSDGSDGSDGAAGSSSSAQPT
jgi:hypothetical protein